MFTPMHRSSRPKLDQIKPKRFISMASLVYNSYSSMVWKWGNFRVNHLCVKQIDQRGDAERKKKNFSKKTISF